MSTVQDFKNAPKTAREALDMAWGLAHPVKKGQHIPKGTPVLRRVVGRVREYQAGWDFDETASFDHLFVRTFDPLPDPKLDWLDAPAVLATCRYSDVTRRGVFTPSGVYTGRWVLAGTVGAMHWTELRDVTPLYPEGEKE